MDPNHSEVDNTKENAGLTGLRGYIIGVIRSQVAVYHAAETRKRRHWTSCRNLEVDMIVGELNTILRRSLVGVNILLILLRTGVTNQQGKD